MKNTHEARRFAASIKSCCLLILAGLATNAQAQFQDDCLSVPTVSEGLFAFDLTSATSGSNPFSPSCGNGALIDQWIKYAPTVAGTVSISTLGLSTGDTVISVHDVNNNDLEFDCAFAPVQVRACDDDAQGTAQSQVLLNLFPGATYLVRISGANESRPVGSVRIEQFIPDAGDTCANPLVALDGVNT